MAIQMLASCHGQTLIPSDEQCEQPLRALARCLLERRLFTLYISVVIFPTYHHLSLIHPVCLFAVCVRFDETGV
jgi:hypothetical protein